MRRWLAIVIAALAFGALSGVAAYQKVRLQGDSDQAHWREIAWPFPRDGWPAGRALRCEDAACGEAVELYLRPKIGFCNCDTGVADDDEFFGQRVLAAIEQFQRLARARMAHHDRAVELRLIECMQRLAELQHDVVRHVDDGADRAQA